MRSLILALVVLAAFFAQAADSLLERGLYSKTEPRYTLVSAIPGYNSIAVERQETHKGVTSRHLAVFEFRDAKVSRIIEYWK